MILDSRPGMISMQAKDGSIVVFPGEWTLEPKFYLSRRDVYKLVNGSRSEIEISLIEVYLGELAFYSEQKGWHLVIEY